MEYYSATKRNKIVPFAETKIDPETVIQSEVNQKEKNKYHVLTHTCGIQRNGTDEPICKAEIETDVENKGGMDWEIGVDIYTLPCIK